MLGRLDDYLGWQVQLTNIACLTTHFRISQYSQSCASLLSLVLTAVTTTECGNQREICHGVGHSHHDFKFVVSKFVDRFAAMTLLVLRSCSRLLRNVVPSTSSHSSLRFASAPAAKAANLEAKSNFNIGTIGHIDHGKTTLTAAITKVLSKQGEQQFHHVARIREKHGDCRQSKVPPVRRDRQGQGGEATRNNDQHRPRRLFVGEAPICTHRLSWA